MLDTMTMTKVLGGFCGAFLVFLLGGWAAEVIINGGEGGHGGEEHQAYSVEVPESGAADAEPVDAGPPFEELFAAADPAEGESLFRACQSCHSLEAGKNGTGPSLHGVVGRPAESAPGFEYDGALKAVVDVWTPENLNHFITAPQQFAPGTKMTYNGMRDAQDRANLIAFLATQGG